MKPEEIRYLVFMAVLAAALIWHVIRSNRKARRREDAERSELRKSAASYTDASGHGFEG
jgi:hypothetical protein